MSLRHCKASYSQTKCAFLEKNETFKKLSGRSDIRWSERRGAGPDVKEEEQDLTIRIMILSDLLNYCMDILSLEVFLIFVFKKLWHKNKLEGCVLCLDQDQNSYGPTYNLYQYFLSGACEAFFVSCQIWADNKDKRFTLIINDYNNLHTCNFIFRR